MYENMMYQQESSLCVIWYYLLRIKVVILGCIFLHFFVFFFVLCENIGSLI